MLRHRPTLVSMTAVLSAVVSFLSFRRRGRASLELELVALRHQVAALRRSTRAVRGFSAPTVFSGCSSLPDLATGLAHHGAGQAGNRDPVASQRLAALLAMAIKIRPSGTAQDVQGDP